MLSWIELFFFPVVFIANIQTNKIWNYTKTQSFAINVFHIKPSESEFLFQRAHPVKIDKNYFNK